ncbi:MAG: hypothetical protein DWQ07_18220 [Chloroflexi bacterium]|nr:MAG: hypothetical protein DWQ07_18220 [Chloroflexota bacterium]MBL1197381.1 hypothetical protein [Chloroflexota bacterium]NOH14677.1 hypothetical protein [Chloroflexota bacterium]
MADQKKRLNNTFLILTCLLVIASVAGHFVADLTGLAWDSRQSENAPTLSIYTADTSLLHSGLALTSAMMVVISNLVLAREPRIDINFKGWKPPSLLRPPIIY